MFRIIMVLVACVIGGATSAASLNALDLILRLETIGFSTVTVRNDDDAVEGEFDFLDVQHDTWGLTKLHAHFTIGDEIALKADLDETEKQIDVCYMGSFSCKGAYGRLKEASFSIGDGAGATLFGDFHLAGGLAVGDKVSLATFDGGPYSEDLNGGGYVTWDMYVHNFSVSKNNLAASDVPFPASPALDVPPVVPLPASFVFLVAGLGGLRLLKRRIPSCLDHNS